MSGRIGYIGVEGNVRIPAQFEFGGRHVGGLAPVKMIGGGFGYIDQLGRMEIEPKFDWADNFDDGKAIVQIHDLYGMIDRGGQSLVPAVHLDLGRISEGLARFQNESDRLFGFLDNHGRVAIPPSYSSVDKFSEGLCFVRFPDEGNRYYYIDRSGNRRLGPYSSAGRFSDGLAPVTVDGRCSYISREGTEVFRLPRNCYGHAFSEGVACVADQNLDRPNCGLIDKSGKWRFSRRFNFLWYCVDGWTIAELDGAHGVIDQDGRTLIRFQFEDIVGPFNSGLMLAKSKGNYGYIDRAGLFAIKPRFAFAQPFSESMAAVEL